MSTASEVADGFGDDQIYFLRGFDTTLFRAESVKYRRNQGLFVMKALFLARNMVKNLSPVASECSGAG